MLSERLLGLILLGGFAGLGGSPSFGTASPAAKLGDSVVTCIQRVPVTNKTAYERFEAGKRAPERMRGVMVWCAAPRRVRAVRPLALAQFRFRLHLLPGPSQSSRTPHPLRT